MRQVMMLNMLADKPLPVLQTFNTDVLYVFLFIEANYKGTDYNG